MRHVLKAGGRETSYRFTSGRIQRLDEFRVQCCPKRQRSLRPRYGGHGDGSPEGPGVRPDLSGRTPLFAGAARSAETETAATPARQDSVLQTSGYSNEVR